MEDSINDLPGGFDVERHYSILVLRYLNRHPESSEYEMVKNDIEFYESFVDEVRTSIQKNEVFENEHGKFTYDIDYLKRNEKYLEFLKEKLRILQLEEKLNLTENSRDAKKVKLPYQIAMLDHIGFFQLEYFKGLTQSKVDMITAKLLNTQERSVRGNRSALEDKNVGHHKYTSYNHKNDIENDISNLKHTL